MEKETVVKVSEKEVLVRQALCFTLGYMKAHRGLFGSYRGYRNSAVLGCFYKIQQVLPTPLKDLDWDSAYNLFPSKKKYWEGTQLFVSRFNTTDVVEEVRKFEKLTREWIISKEMARARKAVTLLKKRVRLPGFKKKYPKLKQALETL